MADIDISSYPKPAAAPAQKSLLDQVQQYQQLEAGKNVIDKQKLDLVNQRFGEMAKGFTGLIADKDLTEDKVRNYIENQVKLGYVPAEMAAQTISQLPPKADSNTLKQHLRLQLQHAQTTVDAINAYNGQNENIQSGNQIIQGVRQSPMSGGGFTPSTTTNIQVPPTQEIVNPDNSRGLVGPLPGPMGPQPARAPSLPVENPASRMPPAGPINGVQGQSSNFGGRVLSAVAEPPTPANAPPATFAERMGAAYKTAPVPGAAEAQLAVGAQSGKDFATDLSRARNYKADLYPSERVLDIVKAEGNKAFGPGTEGLNTLKSALVTWLPNVDQKTIDGVSNYEQAKKYLVQAARSNGSTGTNDQLAAAFEANPNVKMSGATIENVVKSNIALRKMQHAQTLLAEQQKVPPQEYSSWIAKNQNQFDARAFGFDLMSADAKQKLVTELKKDPKALKKFENSLQFAHDADLIEPPTRK